MITDEYKDPYLVSYSVTPIYKLDTSGIHWDFSQMVMQPQEVTAGQGISSINSNDFAQKGDVDKPNMCENV